MKVAFCTFAKFHNRKPGTIGSSKIRCEWLYPYWKEAEEYQIGKKYDVMIFQKVYWLEFAQDFKGIKILDLCDPDWLDGAKVVEMIQQVDAVTTSTEALATAIRKFTNKPVKTIPDRVNFDIQPIIKREHKDEAKKALWFGYNQNSQALDATLDFLHENNYDLVVYSNLPYTTNKTFNVKIENIEAEEGRHDEKLLELSNTCDILLNPKASGERFKYKSNNKTIIGWGLGLPVVDDNPDDLVRYKKAEERNKEVTKRQKELVEKWDCKYSVADYKSLIKELQDVKV